nr:ribonuclease H-like domain-containing protein [Tanacetum cinerariifolium]
MELLSEYGMLACKPAKAPIPDQSKKKDKDINEIGHSLSNITCYQKIVGKLIYVTMTMLDIAYISKKFSGIYCKHDSNLSLRAYVDSDWAKCKVTRKSVTRYVVYLGSNLVSWKSKKQSVLSKSSAEAEYRAMNNVTYEIMWILKILKDLNVNVEVPVSVSCDSSSAIQIADNPVFH